ADIALFRTIPNSKIFTPSNALELVSLLRTIFEDGIIKGVVAIRYPKDIEKVNFDELWERSKVIDPFHWEIIRKGKSRIAILAVGDMEKRLEKVTSLDPTVVYVRCVKPLDEKTLKDLADEHEIFVTIEEGFLNGGFGESVLSFFNRCDLKKSVLTLGVSEQFVPHGSREELLKYCGLDSESIFKSVVSFLEKEVYAW
ncbi:MAG: transketolase C-terminal domain-containing protein, partial [Pseudothermotoga sp.]